MNFSWIWTVVIHAIIIIINWIIKKPVQFIILLLVFAFFFSGFLFISKSSLYDSNISYIQNYHSCGRTSEIDPNKKYIILRLDDVQSSYLKDLTIKMLNEWFNRKMPFTLAVIPLELENDPQMLSYLKGNNCNIEIAQHGFNNRNDIAEFQDLPESVASNKLEQWLKILNEITDQKIITFIPPENIYSTGTAISAKKKKFKIISWEWNALFDYSAATYNFDTLKLNTVDYVINQCEEEIVRKGFSIIMIHPQDYVDENGKEDPAKYKEYIKLLDTLENEWFAFTTMYDYYNYLEKEDLAESFYDSSIKKLRNKRDNTLSNSWTEISLEKEEDEKNKITRYNYLKKSEIISFPKWVNNYNYITNNHLILNWKIDEEEVDAIYINDYKLRLFKPWDKSFSYILNTEKYINLKKWKNIYNIYFEKNWVKELKEKIVFFYNTDWTELVLYEEILLKRLNEN